MNSTLFSVCVDFAVNPDTGAVTTTVTRSHVKEELDTERVYTGARAFMVANIAAVLSIHGKTDPPMVFYNGWRYRIWKKNQYEEWEAK